MMKTKDISYCAFAFVLLVLCSRLVIPLGFIPLTLQTLGVILCGLTLTKKQIIITFTTYLVAGLCGLPVFATGGGLSYVLQPSFGFLLSFPIAAYMLASCRQYHDTIIKMIVSSIFALLIIYTIGAIYMYLVFSTVLMLDKSVMDILAIGVLPFVFNDGVSAICACFIAQRIICAVPYLKKSHSII